MTTKKLFRARIFISHNHVDKPIARHISKILLEAGHEVWLDEWEMKPGDSLISKISEGLDIASHLLVLLSKDSVKSKWVKRELEIALNNQITTEKMLVVPCLLEDCQIPTFLSPIVYADFRKDFQTGIEGILNSVSLVDYGPSGHIENDDSDWHFDYSMDYDYRQSKFGGYWLSLVMISHPTIDEGHILFNLKIEAQETLKNRLDQISQQFKNPAIPAIMFLFMINDILELREECGEKDISIMVDGPTVTKSALPIIDRSGRKLYQMEARVQFVGSNPDHPILYEYGGILHSIVEKELLQVRRYISKTDSSVLHEWIGKNPMD